MKKLIKKWEKKADKDRCLAGKSYNPLIVETLLNRAEIYTVCADELKRTIEQKQEKKMVHALNPSESICGFVAWLTCRKEKTLLSSSDDAAPIVELIKQFCTENKLPEVSSQWPANLIHPSE